MTEQSTMGVCSIPGCGRPRMVGFPGCVEHRAHYDAKAELEAWELARHILKPWVRSAEPIGSPELTQVMEGVLEEVEANISQAQDGLERAEAAL